MMVKILFFFFFIVFERMWWGIVVIDECYLVDFVSSYMFVLKIKLCMCKYE